MLYITYTSIIYYENQVFSVRVYNSITPTILKPDFNIFFSYKKKTLQYALEALQYQIKTFL